MASARLPGIATFFSPGEAIEHMDAARDVIGDDANRSPRWEIYR
jgi:hypothetical protein